MTTEPRITADLVPAFGDRQLKQITREQMQEVIDRIGIDKSRSIVDHLRWDLNSIFKMAVSDGLVDFNPAAALFTGACKPQAGKRVFNARANPRSPESAGASGAADLPACGV